MNQIAVSLFMEYRSFGPLFVFWPSFWLSTRTSPGRAFVLATWLGLLLFGPNAWAASAPTITTPPANQVVADGGTVNLSVAASGDAPLTYQWLKDGRVLLGAANSALSLASASVTDSGVYYVVVANASSLSISLPVTVRVGVPQLLAWGYNGFGELGVGSALNQSNAVSVASNVVAMAAGANHSLYLKSDGTLWGMGYNADGELGNGTTNNDYSPVAVSGMSLANVISGSCASHTLAVDMPVGHLPRLGE